MLFRIKNQNISRMRITCIVLCTACIGLLGFSSPGHSKTIGEALEAALNYHPSVKAAAANRDALNYERKEFMADYFPSLSVTATGGRMYADNSVSRGLGNVQRGAGYSYLWEGNVSLVQPIFDGFETTNRINAVNARKQSANFNIIDIREQLALQTVLAYLDVLRTEEALEETRRHREKLNKYIDQIQGMIKEGAADSSMMLQAFDIRAQLDTTLADLKAQALAAKATYEETVGEPPEKPMNKPHARLDLLPETGEEAVAEALNSHPILKAAEMTQRASMHDVSAEKATLYPALNGELSALERDQEDLIGGESTDSRAVLRMSWDISLAGRELSTMRRAKMREKESYERRREQERQIAREVRVTWGNMERSNAQAEILQSRHDYTQELFTTFQSQFEAARVDLLQLVQTDNQRFSAKLAKINGDFDLLAAHFSVLASMGRLQDAMNVVAAR